MTLETIQVRFIGGWNQNTRRKSPTCRNSLTHFITYCCIEYTSPWTGSELTTGSKSNNNAITATTTHIFVKEHHFYCCSTFPSHSQVFNELILYPKMGVKRSPTCSWPVLKLQQKYRYIQMIIKKNIHRFTLTKKGIVELRGLFFLKEHRYARLNW